MRAGEMCMRDVAIAAADDDVMTAAKRMRELHVGSLVVVDEEDGDRYPVGIVTDRDLLVAVLTEELGHARELSVRDVMTTDILTAREDEDVYDALQRMRGRGVRRLPVVDDQGRLAGILTFDDLVEWVTEELEQLTKLVRREQERERATRP
jgi:CBS domain-containing protein